MSDQRSKITSNKPLALIEPDQTSGLWENLYGRKLTHTELFEIESNVINFFEILIDEDKRQRKAK